MSIYSFGRKVLKTGLYTAAIVGIFSMGYSCGRRSQDSLERRISYLVVRPIKEKIANPILETTINYLSGKKYSEE